MKIEINLEEDRFKDLLDEELGTFSKEELHEILREAMAKRLETDDQLKKLFISENNDSYWNKVTETPLVAELVKSIGTDDVFDEMKKKIIGYLTSDEVVFNILKKAFIDKLLDGLSGNIYNNGGFQTLLYEHLKQILSPNQNQ